MSQATNWGVPTSGPVTPTDFATRENASFNALLSCHSGSAAPGYAVEGTFWLDTSGGTYGRILKQYDGSDWVPVAICDPTSNTFKTIEPVAECRLSSPAATQLRLDRYNGQWLMIGGLPRRIPAAGVVLGNAGLAANTTYYIYASWSGTAIVLQASTTAWSIDAATGMPVKNGDASQTLVGMARTTATSQFAENGLVASYFNRRTRVYTTTVTGSTTSGTPSHFAQTLGVLCWGDDNVVFTLAGSGTHSVNNGGMSTWPTVDGATGTGVTAHNALAGFSIPGTGTCSRSVTEGFHTFGAAIAAVGAGTVTATLELNLAVRM